MSVRYEDFCVGCPQGMGCLGGACPYTNVEIITCDICEDECDKVYRHDGKDYCPECFEDLVREEFENCTIQEQAEILGIDFEEK